MSAELVIHGNHCGSTPNVAQSVNFSSSAFPSNITTVAQALDYCFENKVKVTTLSQAEYNALPTDQKNKGLYVINDAPSLTAATLIYDGEDTGLGSNVQDAIDTLSDNLTSLPKIHSGVASYSGNGSGSIDVTISIGKTLSNTNYAVITSNGGAFSYATIRLKTRNTDSFVVNVERSTAMASGNNGTISWLVIEQ